MIDAQGQWMRGWEVEGKDGEMYPCGVLCDRQALAYARRADRRGAENASLPLPLHRHHHRLALAGVLLARTTR